MTGPLLSVNVFWLLRTLIELRYSKRFHACSKWSENDHRKNNNFMRYMMVLCQIVGYKIKITRSAFRTLVQFEQAQCLKWHCRDKIKKHDRANLLTIGPRQANLVLIAYASSEGSGEPAHPRSLARTSAARSYKHWIKRNLQTENQIPSPSEWLGMRS